MSLGTFGPDNRVGIPGTLHRISAIRNRCGDIVGLTFRVGRPFVVSRELVSHLLETSSSILLLGNPGVGKTSVIRDISRRLSCSTPGRRVVIIDTSNEIGGDADVPHAAVGAARRMQVPQPSL